MTSPLAGKTRLKCDVCSHYYYYVTKTAAALELRPHGAVAGTAEWLRTIALPAGALVCDRCAKFNGVERQTNPLPLQKQRGVIRMSHRRRPLQTLVTGTLSNPEAERLRAAASELRSIGDALVERGRMRGTHDRLNVLADELVVMSQAADVADLLQAEASGRVLDGGRR